MNKRFSYILSAVAVLLAAGQASAFSSPGLVELGTASGGLMIYYNRLDVSGAGGQKDGVVSGYDERPENQAYIRMQFGYDNRNGAAFQFSPTDLGGWSMNSAFSGLPVGQSQFGFDLQGTAATYDGSGGVLIPQVFFADNVNNSPAGAAMANAVPSLSQGAWAINDYKEPTGPEQGGITNSLFRGTSFTLEEDLTVDELGRYVLQVSGTLVTDGKIHWYTAGTPDGDLASWGLADTLEFSGTLIYDPNYARAGWDNGENTYSNGMDNGHDQKDFYAGQLTLYAQAVAVPLPSAAWAGLALLGAMSAARVARRNR